MMENENSTAPKETEEMKEAGDAVKGEAPTVVAEEKLVGEPKNVEEPKSKWTLDYIFGRWYVIVPIAFFLLLFGQTGGTAVIQIPVLIINEIVNLIRVDQGLSKIALNPVIDASLLYLIFIGIWVTFLIYLVACKPHRMILKSLWTKPRGNNILGFLFGILVGGGLNALCILFAWLHHDISLTYSKFEILPLIFLFVSVFIQSSAEELTTRVFIYQAMRKSYKPWAFILVNSVFFGALHLGNSGVTILSILNIILTGILFSLMVYYLDSFWSVFAAHTAWNFCQNFVFGLPNSGMVSKYSIIVLDTDTARDSLFYNVGFGVEGTVSACVILTVACLLFLLYGKLVPRKEQYDIWMKNPNPRIKKSKKAARAGAAE